MKKWSTVFITIIFMLIIITGCSKADVGLNNKQPSAAPTEGKAASEGQSATEAMHEEEQQESAENTSDNAPEEPSEPAIIKTDWSDYFAGINGTAVIYSPAENCYEIYNEEQALTRRSPCSTFKIISSLAALENGIIIPGHSTRTWSGEIFWNEDWNRDIDFADAFHASCVWYFREVIDEIGEYRMQEELNKLEYGNCDISDWSGSLNNNNGNPALNGFWIESSLLISPKEQTEAMERIFGEESVYPEEILKELKQAMLLQDESDILIYGKTGMGKSEGVVVDAWYTGFAESDNEKVYFCVYLGETEEQDVSSSRAREIAVAIVSDYLSGS